MLQTWCRVLVLFGTILSTVNCSNGFESSSVSLDASSVEINRAFCRVDGQRIRIGGTFSYYSLASASTQAACDASRVTATCMSSGIFSPSLELTRYASCNVVTSTALPSIVSFSASPESITAGQSSTLSWSVSGALTVSISGIGVVSGTSRVVTPASSTTYVLTAANGAGSVNRSITVSVTAAPPPPPPPPDDPPPPPPPSTGPVMYFSDCQTGAAAGCVPGNNANSGSDINNPKQDISGINLNALPAGTTLLFKRGGSWNYSRVTIVENRNVTPTQPLSFDAYGSGAVPLFRMTVGDTWFVTGMYNSTYMDGGYSFRNLKLDGLGIGTWGFFLGNHVRNVTIENVEITRFQIGIHSQQNVQSAIVRNNNINTNSQHGILGSFQNSVLDGNLVENNNEDGGDREHGFYLSNSTNTRVTNNHFRNNSLLDGVCRGGNLTVHGVVDNMLIEGNLITQVNSGGGCAGISVTAGYATAESFTNLVVRNNEIVNISGCNICISSAPGALVEGNRMYNNIQVFEQAVSIPAWGVSTGDAIDTNQTVRDNLACFANGGGNYRLAAGTVASNNVTVTGAAALSGVCAR